MVKPLQRILQKKLSVMRSRRGFGPSLQILHIVDIFVFDLKVASLQQIIYVELSAMQFSVMSVAAHAKNVIECMILMETRQKVTCFRQQCFPYVTSLFIKVEVTYHTDLWIVILAVFVPCEIRLPVLNKAQYMAFLC